MILRASGSDPLAQERRAPRLGWLDSGRAVDAAPQREAVRQALVGYVNVDALTIAERHAEGRPDRLPALAAELVKLRVDTILAVGSPALRAARQATTTVPIVALAPRVGVGRGGDAGPNVTGVTFEGPEVSRRRLELLKTIAPGIKSVALHAYPGDEGTALRETQAVADRLGVAVVALEAADGEGLGRALGGARPDALIVPGASAALGQREEIVNAVARARLPAMFPHREFVDAGGMASYGPNLAALYRRAGALIGKTLIGTPARDLPVETPSRHELVVSRKVARLFGIEVPASVLGRADEVR